MNLFTFWKRKPVVVPAPVPEPQLRPLAQAVVDALQDDTLTWFFDVHGISCKEVKIQVYTSEEHGDPNRIGMWMNAAIVKPFDQFEKAVIHREAWAALGRSLKRQHEAVHAGRAIQKMSDDFTDGCNAMPPERTPYQQKQYEAIRAMVGLGAS